MRATIVSQPTGDFPGVQGVDMLSHPLSLGAGQFASAVNLQFDNGRIKTRPGFRYDCLGPQGQFQGATFFSPSKGMSSRVFASEEVGLALAVGGKLFMAAPDEGCFPRPAFQIGGGVCFPLNYDVNLFAAEDWLIAQSFASDTFFWNGSGEARRSPGMKEPNRERPLNCPTLQPPSCDELGLPTGSLETIVESADCASDQIARYEGDTPLPAEDSHDSFMSERHEQWLVNGAGLGVYAHGRVHQQTRFAIFVGDIIHKRGFTSTDDLLLMEEQALESFGDPLVWASSMGEMTAFRLLPQGKTPNGQGPLIGYFANGIMTFNTFQFPRESRVEGGQQVTQGWGDRQMSEQQTSIISAVGRYAVTDLTSDHVFRSSFGMHTLKNVLGEKTEKTEQIDVTSHAVKPLLVRREEQHYLRGTSVGFWPTESRIFCTTGMFMDSSASSSSLGRGFVSYNQATRFTRDRTPIPVWEGLWLPHEGIKGIHLFTNVEDGPSATSFGFLASSLDDKLLFAFLDAERNYDELNGREVPIEWSFETAQFSPGGYDVLKKLREGRLEVFGNQHSHALRVLARSNLSDEWQLWKEVDLSNLEGDAHKPVALGEHPTLGEATWFQIRVEGLGYCEVDFMFADISTTKTKTGEEPCRVVKTATEDIYRQQFTPQSDRWQTPPTA